MAGDFEPSQRSAELMAALGELQVAQEELRVAEEEIAAQRAQLEELLARFASEQGWRERLTDLLSVGVLVTDEHGAVVEASPAACTVLDIRPVHLPRKPLVVFVDPPGRDAVRAALGRLRQGSAEERVRVTLHPRRSPGRTVELVGLPEGHEPGAPRFRWVVVPDPQTATGDTEPPRESAVEQELAVASSFARLCLLPLDDSDPQQLLQRMAGVVRGAVPGASAVGISLGDPREPERIASDTTAAQQFDGLQMRTGEGPCLEAFDTSATVVAGDVGADPRWPRLGREARGSGVRAALGLPVRSQGRTVGVLNVYSGAQDAFPARAVQVGELVAMAVAAVLRAVEEKRSLQALSAHLNRAMESRAVIEQAKGIIMAALGGTEDDAFARLVALSSRRNVKLRELALALVSGRGGGLLREL